MEQVRRGKETGGKLQVGEPFAVVAGLDRVNFPKNRLLDAKQPPPYLALELVFLPEKTPQGSGQPHHLTLSAPIKGSKKGHKSV